MRIFPDSALVQLEFDKVRHLLSDQCRCAYAQEKAEALAPFTVIDAIRHALQQTAEYSELLRGGASFPDTVMNLDKQLRLLTIPGAALNGEELLGIRSLGQAAGDIFRWFNIERKEAFPALWAVARDSHYEKAIVRLIDEVLDETGAVRDSASPELARIRHALGQTRTVLRQVFGRILRRLSREGMVSDTGEAFLNGRRVVALLAERKRAVRGILHGESDTRKTSFIEPEETIELNNEIFSLEQEEQREVYRILRELTARLAAYAPLLEAYHRILGEYDFIRARAKLGIQMEGAVPRITEKAHLDLISASHPLLLLYNRKAGKPVNPVSLTLDQNTRILVISGPNAGGKTVTMKTAGLLQVMVQCGLMVPAHPDSTFGLFRQLMIHIGDTQSLEFELSTYSAHLLHMKYFIEHANGKTLFFIDELGSGSDPSLGGAFAEVILEELIRKHAMGIVTTHYLNLKIMAGKTPGIGNAAMAFDEEKLQPRYRLILGKPGSSYTFSIADRIGLEKRLIERARQLVDEDHFRLDKLLTRSEQDLQIIEKEKKELQKLIRENEKLKKEMEHTLRREQHQQQVELLKQRNRITEERIAWLRDMERKLRQLIADWKKAELQEDKSALVLQMQRLLFRQPSQQREVRAQQKLGSRYRELEGEIQVGQKVLMKKSHQVGEVREIRGRKAIVQLGLMPITVDLSDLRAVEERRPPEQQASA